MDTFGQFELWDSLKCPDYRGFVIFELRSYCMHHYVTGTDSKSVLIRADYEESFTWGFHCNCDIVSL